ncbi:hypothetical protein GCM10009836_44900 [Pseudonocardia ailaonensis]|uniref:Uncharacterized protein n=1 Tax=Pseudonocardia ailaonensis TaxID=367279 RepID=A0ABN2NE12_9PSEU
MRLLSVVNRRDPRIVTADVELSGMVIRRGRTGLVSLPATNCDPATVERPEGGLESRAGSRPTSHSGTAC